MLQDETNGSAVSLSLGVECLRSLERSSLKSAGFGVEGARESGGADVEICARRCGWRRNCAISKRAGKVRLAGNARVYNVENSFVTGRSLQWQRKINSIVCSNWWMRAKSNGYVAL